MTGPIFSEQESRYKMQDSRTFVLLKCIVIFDAEQVYWKLQVTNFDNKEVTAKSKTETLE